MRRKLLATLIATLVVAFGGLGATLIAGDTPALGLDLQGGISITQRPIGDFSTESLDLAVDRIRDRVDSLGVSEPEILRQGDVIVVNLPGVKNAEEAERLVQVTGQVYLRPVQGCFGENPEPTVDPATETTTVGTDAPTTTASGGPSRQVHSAAPTSTEAAPDTTVTTDTATATTDPATVTTDDATGTTAVGTDTTVPVVISPAPTTTVDPAAPPVTAPPVVSDPTQQQILPLRGGGQCLVGPAGGTGEVFEDDATARTQSGGRAVTVSLRGGASGEDIWNALARQCFSGTEACPSRRLAIELDGEIVSAPSVNEPTFRGEVQITGDFTKAEAESLARVLNSGSLPVRLATEAVQNVSPSLGKDSLRAAVIAGLVGVGLVLLFIILYYRLIGLVALAGLTVSGAIVWTVIVYLSKTQGLALSLAGVAGLIVSVGVTIDSYVVFFERLKDEVRKGRTMRNSSQRAFAASWRTIVVADVVSLIGALVLWYLSVGSVRNFAFFLGLSTLCDLIVAYFFTRPTVLLLGRTQWMARRKVMGIEVATAGAES
jgi:preprotein translocase subunit SecD